MILFVNLIGGLSIGMLKHDMPFGTAVETYSLLTVGDGLIALIPALLISVGAGTVVTRVSSDNASDLGSEIVGQLGSNAKALGLTSAVLFCAAFVPGFPSTVFLTLSALLGLAAFFLHRRRQTADAETEQAAQSEVISAPPAAEINAVNEAMNEAPPPNAADDPRQYRVMLCLAAGLVDKLSLDLLRESVQATREGVERDLGIAIPQVGLRLEPALSDQRFAIELDEVPVLNGELPDSSVLLDDDADVLELLELTAFTQPALVGRGSWQWLPDEATSALTEAGFAIARWIRCWSAVLSAR